jgi:hypothetical protein
MPIGARYLGNGRFTNAPARQKPTLKNRQGQRRPTVMPDVGMDEGGGMLELAINVSLGNNLNRANCVFR